LRSVKKDRNSVEYCWTCTPYTIHYLFKNYNLPQVTYLDADTFFFDNPEILLEEMGSKQTLITEHRYTPEHDQSQASGKYCVQFVSFKNDTDAKIALEWWRNACLNACELNPEKGLCGDQKYLDDWTTRFKNVHELQHLGGGVAPWNVQQYEIYEKNHKIHGREYVTGNVFPVIFYHFHALRIFADGSVRFSGPRYQLSKSVIKYIYKPYFHYLLRAEELLKNQQEYFNPHGIAEKEKHTLSIAFIKFYLRSILAKLYKIIIKKNYNIQSRFP